MFDAKLIQKDFPILNRQVHGKRLVYLDNAATTQKPASVIAAEKEYYEQSNSNIHRGIHTLSEEATTQYEGVREKTAAFIGAGSTEGVIFTRNTTEAINLVAWSWARRHLKKGDEVLLTAAEHHSNLVPWQLVARATGAKLQFIPLTPQGELDLKRLDALLSRRTKLVSFTAMSNVLGTITPVKDITRRAHAVGAKVLVDAAQAVPHMPINVQEAACDFLAFSAHKMLGPTGVGVLYGRPELLDTMEPFLGGGDMILEVWRDHSTWNELPWKFEAGTPNISGVVAFGAALNYLNRLGMAAVRQHEKDLTAYALAQLGKDPHVTIYGPRDAERQGGVVSFNYGAIHPHDLGTLLDQEGIAIRAGHHCCQPLMRDYDISGTARASFYVYNTRDDVDALVAAIKKAATVFSGAFS
ncbi:MAG: cysteine desulfurase [Elusimicrobia bacterium RIFCSPLOWO2_01_FULL_59_12]|nr:MAG: cysteine desulfurase [Elusimicrobia bacterium RIFCSPLOWO2_01_FULL_59_12]